MARPLTKATLAAAKRALETTGGNIVAASKIVGFSIRAFEKWARSQQPLKPLKHPQQTHLDQVRDAAALRREQCRRAQARYRQTEKGKAAYRRYTHGASHRAAVARYRATARGNQKMADINAKRIFIGASYRGRAQTIEQAAVIRQHVKGRLSELKQRLKNREETEGVSTGEVSTQAAV